MPAAFDDLLPEDLETRDRELTDLLRQFYQQPSIEEKTISQTSQERILVEVRAILLATNPVAEQHKNTALPLVMLTNKQRSDSIQRPAQSPLKREEEEYNSVEEVGNSEKVQARTERSTPHKHPLRKRIQHLIEAGIAAVLVASLLLGWFVILHTHNTQEASPTPLFNYANQPGELLQNLTWTPDKRYLTFMACQYGGGTCRYLVWDAARKTVKQTLTFGPPSHTQSAYSVGSLVSPDGRYVFITVGDPTKSTETAELANILTGKKRQMYQGAYIPNLLQAAFSSDGKLLAFIGNDQYLHIWDIAAGKTILGNAPISIAPIGASGSIQIDWSTDNKRIHVDYSSETGAFNVLQVWSAQTGHRLANIVATPTMSLPYVGSNGLSPDEQRILTYDPQAGTFAVRETDTLKILQTLQVQVHLPADSSTTVAWEANGARIVLGYNQQVSLWNPVTGQHIASFSLDNTQQFEESAPDGKGQYIADVQHGSQRLEIRDVLTGKIVSSIPLAKGQWGGFWLFGDRYLTIMSRNPDSGHIYDARTGQFILFYHGSDVSLSSDGKYLAVANNPELARKAVNTLISTLQIFALH